MKRRFHCKKVEELNPLEREVVILSGAQRSRRIPRRYRKV